MIKIMAKQMIMATSLFLCFASQANFISDINPLKSDSYVIVFHASNFNPRQENS